MGEPDAPEIEDEVQVATIHEGGHQTPERRRGEQIDLASHGDHDRIRQEPGD